MLCVVPQKGSTLLASRKLITSDAEAEQDHSKVAQLLAEALAQGSTVLTISEFFHLKKVPELLGQCVRIRALTITNNFVLTHIPDCLRELKNIDYLNLSYNCLAEFSEAIFTLRHLQYLNLSNNQLSSVVGPWERLQELEQLYLDSNLLCGFPASILKLRRLKKLWVLNNPLVSEKHRASAGEFPKASPTAERETDIPESELCTICQVKRAVQPVYTFHDLGGVKSLPIAYRVCSEECQKVVVELSESETVNFSLLQYGEEG